MAIPARGVVPMKVRGCEVVAVLPAAGLSRRLAPLPCSKELLPVGFGVMAGREGKWPKVASHYLLERLRHGGVSKGYVVIRQGKWDIPAYWSDGHRIGMDLAYLVIEASSGPPETIDSAYRFVKQNVVAFGFPDIVFHPADVFARLIDKLARGRGDIVLGLFPAHDPQAMDMVKLDVHGRVRALELKPRKTRLQYAWLCAVWTPTFTEFLHRFLQKARTRPDFRLTGNRKIDPQGDMPVGAVIRSAVRSGLKVDGVMFPTGRYLDIGTPTALAEASRFGL